MATETRVGTRSVARCRLGVDIGGTFTDATLVDEDAGAIWTAKVLTTPGDPAVGFLHVLDEVLKRAGLAPSAIRSIIHATTVGTNAIIERQGARAGLVVTEGFRDILEIARQIRSELYNLQTDKPQPLIPRHRCVEVRERLDHRGVALTPLDEESVRAAAEFFRSEKIDSIAVCLLHAYKNPAHEAIVGKIIQEVIPTARISLSSEVAPEIREYWRASTTVMNAYVAPILGAYVDSVAAQLSARGVDGPLYLMQSNGGVTDADTARRRPVYLLESGPAAGVAVATYYAEQSGVRDAIAFDMGGTTAKMGLIADGRSAVSSEFEVGGGWSGTPLTRGSGYPILGSVVDLVEVGAGGGSIAWIDDGGVLKVGPRSAGADPGPVCYGREGTQPTVTDANLILGRLDPANFAGGSISLDISAAYHAIEEYCAKPLGLDVLSAASGIVEIANATMVQAMRLVSVQRGYDPRLLTLVATGGGGPLHANALAADLEIPRVLVPPSPGVASALGMLVSDFRWDFKATQLELLSDVDPWQLEKRYLALEDQALQVFLRDGISQKETLLERFVELRYFGQSWKLRVSAMFNGDADAVAVLRERFDSLHEATYGYCVPEEPVELVNFGLTAIGQVEKPALHRPRAAEALRSASGRERDVYFTEASGTIVCAVHPRSSLAFGSVIEGPAVIEEADSTTIVHPGFSACVDETGTLLIERTVRHE